MISSNLAFDKALLYLREEINNGTRARGERLPPIRILARRARVSNAAMCAALGSLKNEGLLSVVKNRGAYIGPHPPEHGEGDPRSETWEGGQRWQRLKTQIENDIFNGVYQAGEPLPSLLDLEKNYAVSYKTMRKTLEVIASEGVLVPHKKTYRVPGHRRTYATLVFISTADASSKISYGGYPHTDFLSALRREGGKKMLSIMALHYNTERRGADFANQLKALQEKHSVLGYVFLSCMIPERKIGQVLQVLREVQRYQARPGNLGKPVAIVEISNDIAVSRLLQQQSDIQGSDFRIFSVAGIKAGRQVGQYLLKLGHRKIAFLSYCHKELWSQYRFGGIVRAYQSAGFGEGVCKFVIDALDDHVDPQLAPPDVADYIRQTEAFRLASMKAGHRYYAGYALGQLQAAVENYIHQLEMASRAEPILNAILQEPGLTACVAANDRMALLINDHLARKGVRVPKDISVVSFDDSKAATDNDMTSYNFSFAEIARTVLAYALEPRLKNLRREGNPWECEGMLVERASSGPAPA